MDFESKSKGNPQDFCPLKPLAKAAALPKAAALAKADGVPFGLLLMAAPSLRCGLWLMADPSLRCGMSRCNSLVSLF